MEFSSRRIPFLPQQDLTLTYKSQPLSQTYKPDFICYDKIIVELKAVKEIAAEHKAQLLNYLKASGFELACGVGPVAGQHVGEIMSNDDVAYRTAFSGKRPAVVVEQANVLATQGAVRQPAKGAKSSGQCRVLEATHVGPYEARHIAKPV